LTGVRLLIVEDEWLLADDLAKFFGDMGAVILGPVATVEQAERHTQAAEAAILDIDLKGRRVFPIADELMRRNVPFVFFSGYRDIAIPEHLRHASSLSKSATRTTVFDALFTPQSYRSGARPEETDSEDIFALLPKLRLAARLLLGDVSASDRLVERTLERALVEVETKPTGQATADWLSGIMAEIARSCGSSLLH